MTILATLCYIKKDGKLLLQKKTKELFGGDKYNAPGGKLKENEDPVQGAIREVEEETGLQVSNLKDQGIVHFYNGDEEKPAWSVHVFSTEDFQGELKQETREGTHEWVEFKNIPYNKMWEDDQHFLPYVLNDKHVEGHFYFEKGFGPIYKHKLEVKK